MLLLFPLTFIIVQIKKKRKILTYDVKSSGCGSAVVEGLGSIYIVLGSVSNTIKMVSSIMIISSISQTVLINL